jgi:hypothetical protein
MKRNDQSKADTCMMMQMKPETAPGMQMKLHKQSLPPGTFI